MPSARELLEQADALMRRNRSRETISPAMSPRTMTPVMGPRTLTPATAPRMTTPAFGAHQPAVDPGDFPVLTDALDARVAPPSSASPASHAPPPAPQHAFTQSTPAMRAPIGTGHAGSEPDPRIDAGPPANLPHEFSTPQQQVLAPPQPFVTHDLRTPAAAPPDAAAASEPVAPRPTARAFTDVPVLTDAIEEIDAALLAVGEGEPSIWNDEAMRGDDSVLGPSPKSIAVIPDAREIHASQKRNAEAVATDAAVASAGAVAASTAELIDEVRMQVLQRIDMFTDTGLRDQLGERLKPIVDRASAELVATINQHVGELLRTYVAEAIERELDRLRNELR